MSGFDVLQHISKTPALKAVPVIAFSSSAASADIDKAYKLGCHGYVTKPVDFTSLIKFVVALAVKFLGMPGLQWKGETPRFSDFTASPGERKTGVL